MTSRAHSTAANTLRVNSARIVLLFAFVAGCDSGVEPEAQVSVQVSPASAEVTVGEALQLQATVQNSEGVTWESDRTDVATVSASGLVTAVSAGTVTVTATATADPSARGTASLLVKLTPPSVVSISPSMDDVDVSINSTVSVTFAEAISQTLDPSWIQVSGAGGAGVAGTLSYDVATLTLTFTPEAPLDEFESDYSVTVSGVTNTEGTPMAQDVQSDFTTEFVSSDYYYRLHNMFMGPAFVLDNYTGTPACYMADASANSSGSFWHIERVPGRTTYMLKSQFGGPDLALEGGDGANPCLLTGLAQPGFVFSGQLWSFTAIPEAPGTYRLRNENLGPSKSLDVYNDGRDPEEAVMRDTGLFSGQVWTLVRSVAR